MSISTKILATDGREIDAMVWSVWRGMPNIEARANKMCILNNCNLRLGNVTQMGVIRDSSFMQRKVSTSTTIFDKNLYSKFYEQICNYNLNQCLVDWQYEVNPLKNVL